MFGLRFMHLGFLVILLAVAACGPIEQTVTGPQALNCGPYPVRFRDIVMEHVFETYPGDQVLRSVVVRPPSVGMITLHGEREPGYIGHVRFSVKDAQQQAYRPVTYCYFLQGESVMAFEDAQEASWCTATKDD